MRTVLLGLLLLAVGKVWFQDHAFRLGMSDAVIEAYRERAIEACRRSSVRRGSNPTADGVYAWGPASKTEAVIGNSDVDVALWDTQNPLWAQRFRDPQLILSSTNGSARCAFDVRQGGATVSLAAR
jgi:hypothetical protein